MSASTPPPSSPAATHALIGIAQKAFVGARGVDCVTALDATRARALRSAGVEFAIQYLGTVTPTGVAAILAAGLAFVPVTYANRFDGAQTVEQVRALGLPPGITVFLDVENDGHLPAPMLTQKINAWADAVKAAGYEPGLYVGAGCPLTGDELYALRVVRYWKGLSRIVDRFNALAEPTCGWCLIQLLPSVTWAGVFVDVDAVQQDFRGRTVTWTAQGGA